MGPGMFDDLFTAMGIVLWTSLLLWPLGIWKAVEIVIWLCTHIHIS